MAQREAGKWAALGGTDPALARRTSSTSMSPLPSGRDNRRSSGSALPSPRGDSRRSSAAGAHTPSHSESTALIGRLQRRMQELEGLACGVCGDRHLVSSLLQWLLAHPDSPDEEFASFAA